MFDDDHMSEEEVGKILADALDDGNWFKFFGPFLDIMTINEAVVLCYLHNHSRRTRKFKDWFYCKVDKITKDLRMSEDSQQRTIAHLARRGYIKTRRDGYPSKRYFWIDWAKLAKDLLPFTKKEKDFD